MFSQEYGLMSLTTYELTRLIGSLVLQSRQNGEVVTYDAAEEKIRRGHCKLVIRRSYIDGKTQCFRVERGLKLTPISHTLAI